MSIHFNNTERISVVLSKDGCLIKHYEKFQHCLENGQLIITDRPEGKIEHDCDYDTGIVKGPLYRSHGNVKNATLSNISYGDGYARQKEEYHDRKSSKKEKINVPFPEDFLLSEIISVNNCKIDIKIEDGTPVSENLAIDCRRIGLQFFSNSCKNLTVKMNNPGVRYSSSIRLKNKSLDRLHIDNIGECDIYSFSETVIKEFILESDGRIEIDGVTVSQKYTNKIRGQYEIIDVVFGEGCIIEEQ